MVMRTVRVAFFVVLAGGLAAAQSVVFDFDAPVSGTLADANGNGTGFTHRLPGTGGALPVNDPNLMLSNGVFGITATNSSFIGSGGVNLANMEAPCVLRTGAAGAGFQVTATLLNVSLPNLSNQTGIVVGASAEQIVRLYAGNNLFNFMYLGEDRVQVAQTPTSAFAAGADLDLALTVAGTTCLGWWHVRGTGVSGTLGPLDVPWIGAASTLFVGVAAFQQSHNPAYPAAPFLAQFDRFAISYAGPQANSPDARLEINGFGAGTSLGPFAVSLASGSQFTLSWSGPPNAAIALFAGPMTPFTLNFGCVGSVGIGTPGLLYSDVAVVIDGTAPGLPSVVYHLGPTGTASQTFGWVGPPGFTIGLQSLLFQPATSPCGMVLTAAFEVTTV